MNGLLLIISALLSATIAQMAKIPLFYLTQRVWNWRVAFQAGGMPSSHTALMVGLTTSTLLIYGWNNPYFSISAAITLIVIYDAAGVRRQAGQQAAILNKLTSSLQELNMKLNIELLILPSNLKEVLGHSPIEVLGGIIIGMITALGVVK
ncbi:divergent PAP2 family protein [Desulfosporosinus sp. PR]|uniref:divergent PAP2 family protein n=1 Tax=Candidatus Desulfosporosinus nitrosoreducens TaxID=3401928 RepID=UPI0027F7FDDD|nr:divergent PAP2 family protein [Desulfosporosinus sp. PR]MDQ7095631.1 divergent PAP2 family protein [Desulfosporosinus sp. PR]